MTVYYLDTSALVKRYWIEQGTELVDRPVEARTGTDRFVSSFLTILEVTSATYRFTGSGLLPENVGLEILRRFRRDLDEHFGVWPLDEGTLSRAVQVVEQYRLRSADAIHLATALGVASAVGPVVPVMVSADRELCQAAATAGLHVIDPLRDDAIDRLNELRRPRE